MLVDQDGIKITATEYVTDSIWGDGIITGTPEEVAMCEASYTGKYLKDKL